MTTCTVCRCQYVNALPGTQGICSERCMAGFYEQRGIRLEKPIADLLLENLRWEWRNTNDLDERDEITETAKRIRGISA